MFGAGAALLAAGGMGGGVVGGRRARATARRVLILIPSWEPPPYSYSNSYSVLSRVVAQRIPLYLGAYEVR